MSEPRAETVLSVKLRVATNHPVILSWDEAELILRALRLRQEALKAIHRWVSGENQVSAGEDYDDAFRYMENVLHDAEQAEAALV